MRNLFAKGLFPLVLLLSFFAFAEYASVQSQLRQIHKTELRFRNDVTKKRTNLTISYLKGLNQNSNTYQDDTNQANIHGILLFHNRIIQTKVKANANKLLVISHTPIHLQSNSHPVHSTEEHLLFPFRG
jgi:hypothetical protein